MTTPEPETGHTTVFTFPYRDNAGDDVRATLRIRWEDDPHFGIGTAWWANFSRPPHRLDGEIDGLIDVDELQERVAAQHQAAPTDGTLLREATDPQTQRQS